MKASTPDTLAAAVRETIAAMDEQGIDLKVTTGRLGVLLVDVSVSLRHARKAMRDYRTAVETGQIPAGLDKDQTADLLQACITLQGYLRNLEAAIETVLDDDTPLAERRAIKIAWPDTQGELVTGLHNVLRLGPKPRQLRPV